MKNQIDISKLVDSVFETVATITGDIREARWEAYYWLNYWRYPWPEQEPAQL